ncbi:MAG TPA: copper chaperone PCu(A)C [Anaerolineales bacterium]
MNRILVSILAIAFLLNSCAAPAGAGVQVRDAWARPAPQGANGAIYFVIENHSSETQELVGVEADIAEAVEMHESQMSGDIMEMHQLESVPLGPGTKVTFEPGGLHVMLIGLNKDLQTGDEIEITLHFANYKDIQLIVPVQDTPASETGDSSSSH